MPSCYGLWQTVNIIDRPSLPWNMPTGLSLQPGPSRQLYDPPMYHSTAPLRSSSQTPLRIVSSIRISAVCFCVCRSDILSSLRPSKDCGYHTVLLIRDSFVTPKPRTRLRTVTNKGIPHFRPRYDDSDHAFCHQQTKRLSPIRHSSHLSAIQAFDQACARLSTPPHTKRRPSLPSSPVLPAFTLQLFTIIV